MSPLSPVSVIVIQKCAELTNDAIAVSYVLVLNWTLLQVSVAVLLDKFINETAAAKSEKEFELLEAKRARDQV